MATVTDDFDRADSSDLGPDWTDQIAGIGIHSNLAARVGDPANTERFSYYSGAAWSDDQSSQAVLNGGVINGRTVGLSVRASDTGGSMNAYVLYISLGVTAYIFKWIAGSPTLLQTIGSVTNSSTFKIEVIGTTITCYENGSTIGSPQSDSDLSSGFPGLMLSNNTDTDPALAAKADDWQGDGATVSTDNQPMMRRWGGRSGPVPGIGQSSGGGKAWG
jgi:hypothetical protein